METPTISKKQGKKTLSAKKPKKETIKNVLEKPYNNYWPLVSKEDHNRIKEILERLLPKLKNEKFKVPYKEIKQIPKEERKKFRENFTKQPPIEVSESDKECLIFGVNDVSRLLENQEAASVLIASDVQPRLLVQHILDQAVLYNVPILIINNLRNILKSKCGITGAVFALKKTLNTNSNLVLVQQAIFNIYANYPVPETHINYHRRLNNTGTALVSSCGITNNVKDDEVISISDSESDKLENSKNYHLKRPAPNERAFIPENSQEINKMVDFICLDSPRSVPSINNNGLNKKIIYKPLKVKRLKGDKNRNKRKMEKFKGKKR